MHEPNKPIWFKNELKELPECTLFVGTPVHSEVSIHYAQACLELQKYAFLRKRKVMFQLMKSSLVTQGRNLCVSAFMESKFSHLLFIDSDIHFQPESIYKLVEADKDVISIPYPLKSMMWAKGWKKIQDGLIKSADQLSKGCFTYPMKVEDYNNIRMENGIIEVTHSPTGCMLIKRSVLEKMIDKYPELLVDQDTVINGEYVKRPFMYNFFDTLHDPKTKKYLGEDFGFCKRWKDIGGKCHAYVNEYITHIGEFPYEGRFLDELIVRPQNDNITK